MKSPATQPTVVSVVKAKVFLVVVVVFGLFLSSSKAAQAATLYWVGADGANASVASNWSTTNPTSCSTGVTPSGAAPTSADALNFDADCDNGATLDSGFTSTVTSVVLNTGYAGTVTQANPLTVSSTFTTSGGTWTATNQALTVTSTFTMNAGSTFTASSGITTFNGAFTVIGGTFNHNGGTIRFTGGNATLSCNNILFNLVVFNHTIGLSKTVTSTCSMPLGANPTITGNVSLSGTLSGSGTLTTATSSSLFLNVGSSLSGFTGLVTGTSGALFVQGATFDASAYTTFNLNGLFVSSGSLTAPSGGAVATGTTSISGGTFNAPSGNFSIGGALSITGSPTFNANGGTITFNGAGATLSCNNVTFNLITFNNTGTKTVSSNCSLPLGNNPTLSGTANITLNGTLSGTGTLSKPSNTLTLNAGSQLSGFTGIDISSLTVAGATADFSSYTSFNIDAGTTCTLSSGTLTLPSGTNLDCNLTITGGTFNAPSGTMSLAGNLTISGSPTFNANSGTIVFDGANGGTLSCNNVTFNTIIFTHTTFGKTVNSNCTFSLGANPTITGPIFLNGTFIGSGTLTNSVVGPSTYSIRVGGTGVLQGFTGLAIGDLEVAGATLDLSNYTSVVIYDLNVQSGGNFTAPQTMSIGNAIGYISGTFNPNNGTIIFTGQDVLIRSPQTGTDFNFYNLKKTNGGSISFFNYSGFNKKLIVNGTLDLQGTSEDNLLRLYSSVSGSQWQIDARGSKSLYYLDVQDSFNVNGTNLTAICSIDSGNNTGWLFPPCGGSIFTLVSPQNRHYTRDERPTFSWRPPSGAALFNAAQDYTLIIDNGQGSDFIVEGIPANRPNGSNVFESDKYRVEYLNWDNADLSDNLITLTTKSSSSWNSDFHDGKLTEGIRNWRVKLKDSSNSIYEMNNEIFVDFTPPTTEVSKINTLDYVPAVLTSDTTPTIFGKVTDSLIGTPDDRKVASGPKSITILIEQETLTGYQEMLTDTINLTKSFWVSDGKEIENNTENLSAKFSPFEYTFPKVLNNGTYRITLKPADNVDNSFATQIFQIRIGAYAEIFNVLNNEQKSAFTNKTLTDKQNEITIPDPDEDQVEIEKSLQKHLEQKTEGEQGKSQQEENNHPYLWFGGGILGIGAVWWFLSLWSNGRKKKN